MDASLSNSKPRELKPEQAVAAHTLDRHLSVTAGPGAGKTFVLHLLAVVSIALWVGAMWPAVLPLQVLDSALALWVALLFFAIAASIEEWLWRRKVARYQSDHRAKQKLDAGQSV